MMQSRHKTNSNSHPLWRQQHDSPPARPRGQMRKKATYMRSPSPAISGPPDSRIPISQSVQETSDEGSTHYRAVKVLTAVDDGDSHENTSPTPECAHEI